ncbi:MAG: c-type cytochrome [Verrucomicrobia bacterium]|nr:c-type cytochrome [Verrucomicrobiota bacterium]
MSANLRYSQLHWALAAVLWAGASASAEVFLPGITSSQLDEQLKGQALVEEMNCVACHASTASFAAQSKKAPRLAGVGSRLNHDYITAFIRDPHGTKPGTTMPDVMPPADRDRFATEITHFLLSLKQKDFSLQAPDAVAAKQGEKLFHSRGCAACHSPRDAQGAETMKSTSVPLGALEKKYSFRSLVDFLREPHASRPSGRMPDMRLLGRDLDCIAHFLLRDTQVPGNLSYTMYRGQVWQGLSSDEVEPERADYVKDFSLENFGKVHHHAAIRYEGWLNIVTAGRYTFYLQMNGGSLQLDGKEIIQLEPKDRRGVMKLQGEAELAAGWRKIQLIYFHTGQAPSLSFEMEGPQFKRQSIPSSMLSVSDKPIPAFAPLKVNADFAARGREHFGKLGCAKCHDDVGVQSASSIAFAKLNPTRGCLSASKGSWPHFDLSAEQRVLITKALPQMETRQLTDKEQLHKTLATFNCIACHERSGLGGIAADRKAIFTGTAPSLGDQGRLPPPLTDVGAKLTPGWIADVLLHGQRQRNYLDAAMPQFGEANVGHLVNLFGKVDHLEDVSFPTIANIQESKNAGYEMVGVTGFSCIACHDFNGEKSAAGALDIVHTTERLQKSWFHLYLRQPQRFHPTVIMPSYWPGGQSIRPNILGGDTGQQIEALWAYLAGGTQAKKPLGLARTSNELRVADVAEICRGRGTAGYRGIGVGYPARINLAFDSEEMALRLLWKDDFVNVDFGNFKPKGNDRIAFPAGIPFHRLKSLEDEWPAKGKTNYTFPQDQGYQFRGYHLDALRRPAFHYQYGDIAVEEFFEDVRDKAGKAYFKRTFQFDAPEAQQPFYFRAACGKKISASSDRSFLIDQLQLRLTSDHKGIKREGEILIPLTLPKGHSTLTLEYQW